MEYTVNIVMYLSPKNHFNLPDADAGVPFSRTTQDEHPSNYRRLLSFVIINVCSFSLL